MKLRNGWARCPYRHDLIYGVNVVVYGRRCVYKLFPTIYSVKTEQYAKNNVTQIFGEVNRRDIVPIYMEAVRQPQ